MGGEFTSHSIFPTTRLSKEVAVGVLLTGKIMGVSKSNLTVRDLRIREWFTHDNFTFLIIKIQD